MDCILYLVKTETFYRLAFDPDAPETFIVDHYFTSPAPALVWAGQNGFAVFYAGE